MGLFSNDSSFKSENKNMLASYGLDENDFKRFMESKGLDFKNYPITQSLIDEYIVNKKDRIKNDILQSKTVKIHVPSIRTMSDKILTAHYGTHIIHTGQYVADWEGIDTLWTQSELTLGEEACCISLGAKLMPYYMIDKIIKHPSFDKSNMTYGIVMTNGEIINFRFTDHMQKNMVLEVLKEKTNCELLE